MLIRLLFLLFLIPASNVHPFNDERNGFLLGLGLGGGANAHVYSTTRGMDLRFIGAFCLDGKLGFNVADKVDMAFISKTDIMRPYLTTIVNSMNSLEFLFYRKKTTPSWFFTAAPGFAVWFYPGDDVWNEHYAGKGFCLSFGTGYEFRKHWAIVVEDQFSYETRKADVREMLLTEAGAFIHTEVSYKRQSYITNGIRLSLRYTLY